MSNLLKSIAEAGVAPSTQDLTKIGADQNKQISSLGFSLIKNAINTDNDLNQTDVIDYLKKADEINDEVDTIVFGLEDDQGAIVKVYVAKDDADGFEKALGEKLGVDDDIEELLAELAADYDIVDVEWPEEEEEDEAVEGEDDPDQATLDFDTQNSTGEESKEADFELSFEEDKPVKEGKQMGSISDSFKQKQTVVTEAKITKLSEADFPIELQSMLKTLSNPAQEKVLYLISLFNLPKEVIGSKKNIAVFRKNLVAIAREYQKNQTLKIWINRLVDELAPKKPKDKEEKEEVKEALTKKDEDPIFNIEDPKYDKAEKFRDTLPHGTPRLIFDVLVALGVPQSMLTDINRSKVRESIRELTRLAKRTQRVRIYLNLIAEVLNASKEDQSEAATQVKEEQLDEQVTDKFIILVEEIALALGIPQENLNYKGMTVQKSIHEKKTELNWQPLMVKMTKFLDVVGDHQIVTPVKEAVDQQIKNIFKEV